MRYLIITLLVINYGLFAQQRSIDSLTVLLQTSRDNPKVDILLALAKEYAYLKDEKATLFAQEANDVSKRIVYREGEIMSSYELGTILYNKGEKVNALSYFKKGLEKATEINDESLSAKGFKALGWYYEQENNLPKSLEYINRSLTIYAALNQRKEMASCFTALGLIYNRLANYEKALAYNFKALQIKESLHYRYGLPTAFTNIGNIYLKISKFDKANDYFLKSLTLDLENEDKVGVMISLLNLGVANQKMKSYDKAISYYKEALSNARDLNSRFDEAILLGNIGSTLRSQFEFEESLTYLFAALEIKKDLDKKASAAHSYNDISETYFAMERPLEAKKYALEAIAISKDVDIDQYRIGYELLAQSAHRLGDLTNAYEYLQQSHKLKDSIFNLKARAKMDELEIQYQSAKKQEEIHFLTQQKIHADFNKMAYLSGGVFVSVILLMMFRQQRLKNQKNRALLQKEKEVDRMKSQFFANISHEFRTPLTLILGPIEDMQAATDDHKIKYNLEVMKENANKLLKLINQLLDLSKLGAGKFKLKVSEEDIIPIIRGVVMAFHSLAERKEIDLQIHTDKDHLNVFVDREKLETVLLNLLSNAFKFTPKGGKIKVTVSTNDTNRNGNSYSLTISDTGVGIADEDLAQIFNRFYQSTHDRENGHKGTGIGLALTKELVNLHKGTITVSSRVGVGTDITIDLPIGKERFRAEEVLSVPPIKNTEHQAVIHAHADIESPDADVVTDPSLPILLLVEDNVDVMHYLMDIFREDYQILQALDGEQGIEMALVHVPDLIISDVMMPKKDGYAVCSTLKQDERTSHIPIILLTAKASLEDRMEGLETRADKYMTKPFAPQELLLKVNNLISSRKELREKYKQVAVLKPSDIAVNSVDETFLEKIILVVEEHIGDDRFSVEQMALAIGMSRSQLHRKLKALLDQAPNQFIRSFRLQRAHDLLKQNAATSSEIAYQVGFGSPSYFTKCFHEHFGYTPSEIN